MGLDQLDYSVAVKLNGTPQNSWRWEINCAGRSSPVHRSSVHFSAMGAAVGLGKRSQAVLGQIDRYMARGRACSLASWAACGVAAMAQWCFACFDATQTFVIKATKQSSHDWPRKRYAEDGLAHGCS